MCRSLSFRGLDTSRSTGLVLKIAAAASVGVLVACSAQERPAPATTGAVPSSTLGVVSTATSSTTTGATPSEPITQPKIEKKTVVETRAIPFRKTTVKDSSLKKGTTVVTTQGVNGKKRMTYEVTLKNGVQTSKRLLRGKHSVIPSVTGVSRGR